MDASNLTASKEAKLLGPLLSDPNSCALDAAQRFARFKRARADDARAEAEAAEAEAVEAEAEAARLLAAYQAGEQIAPDYPDERIQRDYGRDAREIYAAENDAEIQSEKQLLEEGLARVGLDKQGWRVSEFRPGPMADQMILTRLRRLPRKRLDKKTIAAAIKSALKVHTEVSQAGATNEAAADAALSAYRTALGDRGVYESEQRTRIFWAMEASRTITAEGLAAGLPMDEIVQRRDEAVSAILPDGSDRLELSTGPPN